MKHIESVLEYFIRSLEADKKTNSFFRIVYNYLRNILVNINQNQTSTK